MRTNFERAKNEYKRDYEKRKALNGTNQTNSNDIIVELEKKIKLIQDVNFYTHEEKKAKIENLISNYNNKLDLNALNEIRKTYNIDIEELVKIDTENQDIKDNVNYAQEDIGFGWWKFWAYYSLFVGNLVLITTFDRNYDLLYVAAIIINTVLCIMMLNYNKYAFLISTVFSNPILWLINGIYLKNRWNHPKLNKNSEKSYGNNKKEFTKTSSSYEFLKKDTTPSQEEWIVPKSIAVEEVKNFTKEISSRDNFKISLIYCAAIILRDDLIKSNSIEVVKMLDGKDSILSKKEISEVLLEFRKSHKSLKENGKNFFANGYWIWMITLLTYLYDLKENRDEIWGIITSKNTNVYDILKDLESDGEKISIEVKHNPNYRPD